MDAAASLAGPQLGALTDELWSVLKPGMTTLVVRTPLGTQIIDPFAEPDPSMAWLKSLVSAELHLGPPTELELSEPPLSQGLLAAGALVGLLAFFAWRRSCR